MGESAPEGRHDFTLLWIAATISYAGTAVTTVALPMVALVTLHASTFDIGIISAAGLICWLLLGLSAGVWVDRVVRRPLLIACDVVRALALVTVPIAAALDLLTVLQLIAVALIVGAGSVLFDIASQVYLPAVVPPAQLLVGNSKLQGSQAAAQTGGPALGGLLVQLITAPLALVVDVASYLVSALLLVSVRRSETPVVSITKQRMLPQIKEGLAYVLRDDLVRPLLFLATGINLAAAAFDVLLVPFLLRSEDISPGLIGVLIACGGVGGVVGAAIGPKIAVRIGSARTMLIVAVLGPVLGLLVPMTTAGAGLVLFAVGLAGRELCIAVVSLLARTYRQMTAPPELLARVTASIKFISWGVLPIGAFLGGAAGQWLGNRNALWAVSALALLTMVPILFSPVRGRRDLLDDERTPQKPATVTVPK